MLICWAKLRTNATRQCTHSQSTLHSAEQFRAAHLAELHDAVEVEADQDPAHTCVPQQVVKLVHIQSGAPVGHDLMQELPAFALWGSLLAILVCKETATPPNCLTQSKVGYGGRMAIAYQANDSQWEDGAHLPYRLAWRALPICSAALQ